MEKTTVEKLQKYCRNTVENCKNHGQDWAFGAVCFAYSADLITSEEFKAIMQEFELVTPGTVL